jgi:hypothetical protein
VIYKTFNGRKYMLYGWVLNCTSQVQRIKDYVKRNGYYVTIHKAHEKTNIYYKIFIFPIKGKAQELETFKMEWHIPTRL